MRDGTGTRYFRNHFEPKICFMIAWNYEESIWSPGWSVHLMGLLLRYSPSWENNTS